MRITFWGVVGYLIWLVVFFTAVYIIAGMWLGNAEVVWEHLFGLDLEIGKNGTESLTCVYRISQSSA